MADKKLQITIISQEKQLATVEAESLTVPTVEGEITVLPGHLPLLSRLQAGELIYRNKGQETSFVVSRGFVDVGPDSAIKVMVDVATEAREISLEKAQAAIQAAEQTMSQTTDQRELMLAEASLRRALLEIKVAQKTRRSSI